MVPEVELVLAAGQHGSILLEPQYRRALRTVVGSEPSVGFQGCIFSNKAEPPGLPQMAPPTDNQMFK